jgi:hypothetical protein
VSVDWSQEALFELDQPTTLEVQVTCSDGGVISWQLRTWDPSTKQLLSLELHPLRGLPWDHVRQQLLEAVDGVLERCTSPFGASHPR